jgi:hypothetical protein
MTAGPRGRAHDSDAERYAAGRMAESEELAFEARMLEEPARADEVQAIQQIRHGFSVLAGRGELPEVRPPRRLNPLYALAAALALCVIGALVMATFRSPPVLSGQRASGVRQALFLSKTRGVEELTEVPASGVIEVRILPAVAGETGVYHATLERTADGVTVASNVEVRADQSGTVSLYLDAARLPSGNYLLTLVQGPRQDRFSLRVVSPQ